MSAKKKKKAPVRRPAPVGSRRKQAPKKAAARHSAVAGEWVAFARRVAGVLRKLHDEDALIISRHDRSYFVQATGSARNGIRAEAVSNGYITNDIPLDRAEIARLLELGWSAPTHTPEVEHGPNHPEDGSPNYFSDLDAPVNVVPLATLLATTLRDVYGATDPTDLRYQAFDDDGDALIFSELHLRREEGTPHDDDSDVDSDSDGAADDDLGALVFADLDEGAFESAVRETAQQVLDAEALTVEGGAFAFETPEGFVFVEPVADPRLVRIVTHLGAIAASDAAVHAAVAGANDVLQLGRVVAGDGTVLFLIELLAEPFVPMHVAEGIAVHRGVSNELRQLLAPVLARPNEVL